MLTWVAYLESFKRLELGQHVVQPLLLPQWFYSTAVWIVILTFFWNGLYFLMRVIVSHTTHVVTLKNGSKKADEKDHDD